MPIVQRLLGRCADCDAWLPANAGATEPVRNESQAQTFLSLEPLTRAARKGKWVPIEAFGEDGRLTTVDLTCPDCWKVPT